MKRKGNDANSTTKASGARLHFHEKQIERSRPLYAFAAVLVVGMGLLWRSGCLPLSSFIVKYGGDALWALLVFVGFGFVFRRISIMRLCLISICSAVAIEFSQLYHAHWINSIRSTRLGHLIIGSAFNSPDLIAYVIGVALGAAGEWFTTLSRKK